MEYERFVALFLTEQEIAKLSEESAVLKEISQRIYKDANAMEIIFCEDPMRSDCNLRRLYRQLINLQIADKLYECCDTNDENKFFAHTTRARVLIAGIYRTLNLDVSVIEGVSITESTIDGLDKFVKAIKSMLEE